MNQTLKQLIVQYEKENINIFQLKSVQKFLIANGSVRNIKRYKKLFRFTIASLIVLYSLFYFNQEFQSKRCYLELPRLLRYGFRPAEQCDFCAQVKEVQKLSGITKNDFERYFAYTGTPVVIEDATTNWTALTTFDYWYFKNVYNSAKRSQKILDCQFLPYKTGFNDIFEALQMPAERVKLENNSKPWYFGWSNCNAETAEIFRKHYSRPYFLPDTSENNAVDWFFIGTAGLGAHMHIDNVGLPSWQAQLSGRKLWILAPPPECYFQCQRMEVVVEKGDIIVLDTNKWYHQTFVQVGEISLTIGAEYD